MINDAHINLGSTHTHMYLHTYKLTYPPPHTPEFYMVYACNPRTWEAEVRQCKGSRAAWVT